MVASSPGFLPSPGTWLAMFPRRIHAVTQEGFVIKVLSFVLAHNLGLMAQKMLG